MGAALAGPIAMNPAAVATLVWSWTYRALQRARPAAGRAGTRAGRPPDPEGDPSPLFRALFDATPQSIQLLSPDGRILRSNAAGLALLDRSRQTDAADLSLYGFIAPEYHAAFRRLCERVAQGGAGSMEYELIDRQGDRLWLETQAVPLRLHGEHIAGVLALTLDVGARRRMTRELEEQRNRLKTIIGSEPECVKLHDRDGTILEMNAAGVALLEAENECQIVGRSMYDLLCPQYRAAYRELTRQVFDGRRQCMEFQVVTVSGETRWLESHAAPLVAPDGAVTALLAITRNIDERKEYERRLREQQNELAHVCRISTLGELASGLAHELKQPLCAISSYAETAVMLDASGDRGKTGRVLQKIVSETDRANAIIQRLREFVRKRVPQPTPNDVTELLRESLEVLEPTRRRVGARIDIARPDRLPAVWADRVQTQQVILNLVSNALQAVNGAAGDDRRIAFDLREHGDRVRISLRDFAPGIPEHDRPQLFVPFFTTKPGGLGMGLPLSRSIAEAHGGRLWYEPAEPGSVFHFELPCHERQ